MLARSPPPLIPPSPTKQSTAHDETSKTRLAVLASAPAFATATATTPASAPAPLPTKETAKRHLDDTYHDALAEPFQFGAKGHRQSRPSALPLHPKSLQQSLPKPSYSPLLSSLPQSPPPPPAYAQSHEPTSLPFREAPTAELAPIQPHGETGLAAGQNTHLPSISSVTGSHSQLYSPRSQPKESTPPTPSHWPSMNPLTAYYTPSHAQSADSPLRMDVDTANGGSSGTLSVGSPDRYYDGRANSVSLDDPDVRMAAEALGDLKAGKSCCILEARKENNQILARSGLILLRSLDFVSSPSSRNTPLPPSSPNGLALRQQQPQGAEPLISLLTTSHPLLATTIEGATSAYNNSKNFSPRFKTSAEYVEGYLTPIANKVGSVGRVTGVEGGVRWFLRGARRHQSSSDLEAGDEGSHKRRKVDGSGDQTVDASRERTIDLDLYAFTKDRRTSMSTVDSLPAYDDHRSPAYSESTEAQTQLASRPNSRASAAWQHRLIMSTSGLSIAMSEESLRSLKYCLRWLRWANEHIAKIISTLKSTVEQYERPSERERSASQNGDEVMVDSGMADPEAVDRVELAARINSLRSDVLKTLRDVIDTVSKYAGGALPENARELVKRHLTSLPQRFRLATMQETPSPQQEHHDAEAKEKEVKESAQKVLVLAKEGLDMMAQVSGVLDGTIVSAEEWCERLGRKKRDEKDTLKDGGASEPTLPFTNAGVGREESMT